MKFKPIHGHRGSNGKTKSSTYHSWCKMRERCSDPKRRDYKHYGGRGIRVCERWSVFVNFLADMGERPEGRTLDRIDVEGHYEPGNCKWSTAEEQEANKRHKQKGYEKVKAQLDAYPEGE